MIIAGVMRFSGAEIVTDVQLKSKRSGGKIKFFNFKLFLKAFITKFK